MVGDPSIDMKMVMNIRFNGERDRGNHKSLKILWYFVKGEFHYLGSKSDELVFTRFLLRKEKINWGEIKPEILLLNFSNFKISQKTVFDLIF